MAAGRLLIDSAQGMGARPHCLFVEAMNSPVDLPVGLDNMFRVFIRDQFPGQSSSDDEKSGLRIRCHACLVELLVSTAFRAATVRR